MLRSQTCSQVPRRFCLQPSSKAEQADAPAWRTPKAVRLVLGSKNPGMSFPREVGVWTTLVRDGLWFAMVAAFW